MRSAAGRPAPSGDDAGASTWVVGGTAVLPEGPATVDLALVGGRIVAVGPSLPPPDGATVLDATGLLVLPGVVDVHTHLRLPSVERPNRFTMDTVAAAHGGTTSVVTFTNPGTGISDDGARSPLRGLAEFRERTAGLSAVDVGVSAVIGGHQTDPVGEIAALIESGVPTFKAFMVYDFRLPDADLERAMRTAARRGGMLQLHCEDPAVIEPLVGAGGGAGARRAPAPPRPPAPGGAGGAPVGPRHHAFTRPPEAEAVATRRAIDMARRAEAPLYVVHLSCEAALDVVADAKSRGEPVYAETCPHYLTLTDSLYDDPDDAAVIRRVISPPLRTRRDVDALWEGLRDGVLDVVGSDHVPDRLDTEKRLPAPPFPQISNGAPGIETLLTIAYSRGVGDGRIGLSRLVEVLATTPARLFGVPGKGSIEVGADADLVLFDPDARRVVRQRDLHHSSDFTPFEGIEVRGAVRATLLRGERPEPGAGRFIERRLGVGPTSPG